MFTIPQVVSSVAQDHIDLDTHGKLPGKPFLSEPGEEMNENVQHN